MHDHLIAESWTMTFIRLRAYRLRVEYTDYLTEWRVPGSIVGRDGERIRLDIARQCRDLVRSYYPRMT
jgi:hypothetical protein